jgi:hypothetical protein
MSSELAIYRAPVPDRMRYAEALAQASLLPRAYQRQPANVLLALEYGAALGIAPMTAIQGIHVIEGKPSASAGLIGALVRKAGHRLRVTGDDTHAVAEIVRADDPDFTFRAEWTLDRAKAAGLLGKGVWKSYPAAMLKARAITEVARDACPEALSGVSYTAEELGDDSPAHLDSGSVAVSAAASPAPAPATEPDIIDAEIIPDEPPVEVVRSTHADPGEWATDSGAAGAGEGPAVKHDAAGKTGMWITDPQCKAVNAKARKIGANSTADRNDLVSHLVGRPITTLRDLTMSEASALLDRLKWLEKDEGLSNDTWAEIGRGQAASS